MEASAISLRVRPEHINLEDGSKDTFDNGRKCLEFVQNIPMLNPETVSLISSAWHMHRVLMIAEHFFPLSTRFRCHPTSDGFTVENWQNDSDGRALVNKEFRFISRLVSQKVARPRRFRTGNPYDAYEATNRSGDGTCP